MALEQLRMHLALQDARESVASPILDNKSQTMASVSPATSLDPIVSRLPSNAPFTVKNVATKGFGVFATRDIKMGELILAEEPLIIIEESHYMKADVEAAFNALTEEKQKAYLSLASAHAQDPARYPRAIHPHVQQRERSRIAEQHEARTAEEKSLLSICMTNAMESNDGLGVFEMASRFNHDCVPSASFAWDGRKGVETIHAVRDIAEGEEITLCYVDPYYDINLRAWELNHYGFRCVCKACTDTSVPGSFGNQSRERRWKLRDWQEQVDLMKDDDPEFVDIKLQMVATMKAEGLCTPGMGTGYLEIARRCAARGEFEMAVKGAAKSLEVYTICLGAESERAENAAKSLRAFQKQTPQGLVKD